MTTVYDGTVYNLTVSEAHTFFVGKSQLLMHNCSQQLGVGTNLEASGVVREPNMAAHHVIAENAARAELARAVLSSEEIKIK